MGLKFQKDDSLDKRFDDFAILPDSLDKKEEKPAVDISRFLEPEAEVKKQDDKKTKPEK